MVNKRKGKRKNRAKNTAMTAAGAPPPSTSACAAPPEDAISLPLPVSFTEGEQPVVLEAKQDEALSHICNAEVEYPLAAAEKEEEPRAPERPMAAEEDSAETATESIISEATESLKTKDCTISPEKIDGDLIDKEDTKSQGGKEKEEAGTIETRSTVSRSMPDPVDTVEPPIQLATIPVAVTQPRTSPISALQELDHTAEEFSPAKATQATDSSSSPSTSNKASTSEEDLPVSEYKLVAPYDEVSPSTTDKTKVTFALPEKESNAKTCDEPDLVTHMYEGVKGAWTWSKSHIPLANIWMGLTESIANSVLEVATGNNLHKMDEKVIQPHLSGLDTNLLNPAIHALVEAVMNSDSKDKNPLRSILFAILRPPVYFLVHADDGTKLAGERSVEG
ncbi:hypothetical protein IV203_027625 [Nitzschia inconspicua]|uniref:Uncharacterized protein n=1 Tax=Nitzschia inconspicua TaxID=303405 RepID=A0A9K3LXE3_9STRA|nr:hypothetical protein IV203_027625 [Nitzschia inconspicua]